MADIKLKDIAKLDTWNTKELRKLRITIKNRISAFSVSLKVKDLPANHPLFEMPATQCKVVLENVIQAEANQKRQSVAAINP